MGVQRIQVTVIVCDGHDDDPVGVTFENKWGETYFEDIIELRASEEARAEGWEIGDGYEPPAWCPDCAARRKRAEAGLDELPEEIPVKPELAEVTR